MKTNYVMACMSTIGVTVALLFAGCDSGISASNTAALPEASVSAPGTVAVESSDAPAAPAFTAVDSNGNSHSLADYRGKFVVLEWLNHDCPFVVKYYNSQNMQKLQAKYTDQGVVWLSVVSSAPGKQGHNSPEKTNELAAAKGSKATAILLDEDGAVGRAYGAKTTPQIVVIDPEGRLVYNGAIDDKPTANAADIAAARIYVTEVLGTVMTGQPAPLASSTPYGCSVKY